MTDIDSIYTALDFLKGLDRSFKNTTINCELDEFVLINERTCGLCNIDNIKRHGWVSEDIKELYRAVLASSDYTIPYEDLNKDLNFIFQLANEVRCIIMTVTNSHTDESDTLKEVLDGLNAITNSISFGNPALPEDSGAGIAMSILDMLMYRKIYHAIYKGFTNSTPLAKYFVIINTLNRRTSCSIVVN